MQNTLSLEELLEFLAHAGDRGLMPAATAQALAVATRNVFSVLTESERSALPLHDLDGIVRRFHNKRAKDFNSASLKEYGRRVKRAVGLYLQWRDDPANFSVKTRATNSGRRKENSAAASRVENQLATAPRPGEPGVSIASSASGYQTAFPVRAGHVVTVTNIPYDLSTTEAERLAQFIRLLAST